MSFWLIVGAISTFIINWVVQKKRLKLSAPTSAGKLVTTSLAHRKYQFINHGYEYFKLYNKYHEELDLAEKERLLLNKVAWSSNKFSEIDFYTREIVKLYLLLFEKLELSYAAEGTTQAEVFGGIAELVTQKRIIFRKGNNKYDHLTEQHINSFHQTIFRHCENAIRKHYGHNRKLAIPYSLREKSLHERYQTQIISKVEELLKSLVLTAAVPDNTREIALNNQNKNRWKYSLKVLQKGFNKNVAQFKADVFLLNEQNKKHGGIADLFYEAAKFIARYDSQTAMELYIHHVAIGLNTADFTPQLFTKTVNKRLFETAKEEAVFDTIINDLKQHKSLDTALNAFEKAYRKTIDLDKDLIKIAHEKHIDTVKLLNEYLQEEDKIEAQTTETIKEKTPKETLTVSENKSVTTLNEIQKELLNLFFENNFSVAIEGIDNFALGKGLFKNQLIDEMNDACRELLGDEILIEEEENCYTILEYDYEVLKQ